MASQGFLFGMAGRHPVSGLGETATRRPLPHGGTWQQIFMCGYPGDSELDWNQGQVEPCKSLS